MRTYVIGAEALQRYRTSHTFARRVSVESGHARQIRARSWEARLADLTLESQLAALGQARRAAVASGALEEGSGPR
ncbi:hypothetical protein HPB50_007945 [Hyalomma asiaticum]|uniref:Uncharacterized protein n=1 Tax=Hyalomma asiaticum TaxID=266040 RepID=A0ACB7S664_HYAAI|nr:hypothetical protein HPB50_007945 [Hyalomma asiaticum]